MFKKAGLLMLCLSFAAAVASAAPSDKMNDIGLNVSGNFYSSSGQGDGVNLTARYLRTINDNVALGVESGYYFDSKIDKATAKDGNLHGVPLLFDAVYKWQSDSQAVPYVLAGLGPIFWGADTDSTISSAGGKTDVGTAFGVKLGGGLDWWFNEDWALNLEASYTFSSEDVTVKNAAGTQIGSTGTDFWAVGGGIKYRFA